METLQNLDSQRLIWKIFRNKDLEVKIRAKSGVATTEIWRSRPRFDVKELKVGLPAKGVDWPVVRSQSSYLLSCDH